MAHREGRRTDKKHQTDAKADVKEKELMGSPGNKSEAKDWVDRFVEERLLSKDRMDRIWRELQGPRSKR